MRVKIIEGSSVFQDFAFCRWPNLRSKIAYINTIFDLEIIGGDRAKLTAPGYGKEMNYGNGPIILQNWRTNTEIVQETNTAA